MTRTIAISAALYLTPGLLLVAFGWRGLNWYGRLTLPLVWPLWLVVDGGRERP